mmetsp:Transcript_21268/g.36511  ORF Transcript_21268/g.36511 Transcript_21268/m.36511 type:complete len:100 (-) Transcript_21268:982-1281(-)|eukprot:CAMPEP_0196659362 /NCGR_PEP_ID=MMETSP1086-20130531/34520_1 /TAXON_ID=77921 /ORGANISM="Cyanoptyche  gloeocystis , Strain SAG4.97" /LENGTH=99 /DNA_ID=CAMNT_0041993311 /DNA_START=162 /DNA_END=461 /DNA_ORIENTATION=+
MASERPDEEHEYYMKGVNFETQDRSLLSELKKKPLVPLLALGAVGCVIAGFRSAGKGNTGASAKMLGNRVLMQFAAISAMVGTGLGSHLWEKYQKQNEK